MLRDVRFVTMRTQHRIRLHRDRSRPARPRTVVVAVVSMDVLSMAVHLLARDRNWTIWLHVWSVSVGTKHDPSPVFAGAVIAALAAAVESSEMDDAHEMAADTAWKNIKLTN